MLVKLWRKYLCARGYHWMAGAGYTEWWGLDGIYRFGQHCTLLFSLAYNPMTPEAKVKKAVKRILEHYKIWYFMPSMSGFGRAGIPDFICCIRGRLLGIEIKAQKGRLTRIQEIEHAGINKAGGVCIVLRPDRIQALELLIHLMLRSPNIGTENATIPATEEAIIAGFAQSKAIAEEIQKNAEISTQALGIRPEQPQLLKSEVPVGLQKCKHGTPFAYSCEECEAELCSHGKRMDEPCEDCETLAQQVGE